MIQAKDFKKIIAEKIKNGDRVALYCHGIFCEHLLLYLNRFYDVRPVVIVDNDIRKKGFAEFGIPIVPFGEAREKFGNLDYFICSDDFKYSIIYDMLNKGILPGNIINYVPVEKKRTCTYFENRYALVHSDFGDGGQAVSRCPQDSFKGKRFFFCDVPIGNGEYNKIGEILANNDSDFENGSIPLCGTCPQMIHQVAATERRAKKVAFHQKNNSDCILKCSYCCIASDDKKRFSSLENYGIFLRKAFSLDRVAEDFSVLIAFSEFNFDAKVKICVEAVENAGLIPMVYTVFSGFSMFSENFAKLLEKGLCTVIWTLDAGTRETYKRIKQVDLFDKTVKNAKKYISRSVFGADIIIPKYLIVRGINDNDGEFDAYLDLIEDLDVKFASLDFDFNLKANESDREFIRKCYSKMTERGFDLTYKNTNGNISEAVNVNHILNTQSFNDMPGHDTAIKEN
jgi:hypothetical protein